MIRASSLAVLVVAFSAAAAPAVTAIYPQTGPIGAQVAVSGTGFTGITAVTFNGAAASSISVQNDNLLYAYVPAAATAGVITVTHPTTGSGASSMTFTPLAAPTTATAVPATGSRGTPVTLTGTNYVNVSQVTFNGVAAAFAVVGPTQLTTSVPPGATTGLLRVFTPGGTASITFTVVGVAAPTIASFTPATGSPFTQVTVTGTDFTGTTGATVGGVAASLSVVSDKEVRVTVPGAAPSGTITVTNSLGTATSAGTFTVIPNPVITSFVPATGTAGTQVTITGTGFVNVTQVRLGTLNAAYTVMGPTQIIATVPGGAISNTWRVSTSANTAFSPTTFTVTSAAAPTITSFTPASAGQFAQVTILGTNFTGANAVRFNALPASLTLISDTEIRTSVPSGAATGPLQVQNSIGTATSATSFTVLPPPTVTGFTPAMGPVGTVVTVNGTNFTGVTSVTVGGTAQPFVVGGPTQLTVTLTSTARTGGVQVTAAGGSAAGPGTFTVTAVGPPTISGFSPGSGGWFSQVTIDGTNLNGVTAVQFAGSTSTLVSLSTDTRLFAYVPNGAVSGPITVFNALGSAVSTQPFTVIPPPTLSGFSPASGGQGSAVVLTGTNFSGATSVAIGNTNAGFTIDSATQITATVPPGAQTGTIRVQTPGGSATSNTPFTVVSGGMPVISGFAPASGQPFTSVSIFGSNLTGVQAVLFNGVAGSLQSGGSDTLVRASVPSGATTGPITVTNSLGSAVSTAVFTVLTPPTIGGFAPATGAAGTAVTITGTDFTGTTSVGFNGVAAPFTVTSPTQIATTVPPGATTGAISVSGTNGSTSSAAQFTVTSGGAPTVTGFTPGSGTATALITVTGTNFTGTTAVTVGGQPVSFFSVSNDVRLFVQPVSGSAGGVITVTNPSGSGSSASPYVVLPVPTVTSFTPTSGALGAAVTITGTNFTGATTVRFNNTSTGFVVNSPTSITATVPSGSTGPIQVFGPGGTGTSATPFTINPAGAPTISGFSPAAGGPFSGISVTGTNFTGVTDVKLAGRSLSFQVNSDLNLNASLPADPMTGMLTVTNAMGSATSVGIFTALAAPTVTAIAPGTGSAGTSVTITGTGFTGATQVTFGGVAALFTAVSATQLTASVPVGAVTGVVRVSTPAGSASSTQFFTVTSAAMPAITGFLPASGPAGTQVTISGTGFAGTSVVRFNGLNATFSVLSDTVLLATVPAQATTGTITVINAQGPTTSTASFTVQPAPAVSGISPFTGPVGTAVTVRGTDFTGASLVAFNGTPAAFMVVSATEITATVPAGATTGRISVATPSGTGTSLSNFLVVGVVPTIASFTPASGGAGTAVLVSGTGFSGAQWATVGGLGATLNVLNDLLVAISVPSGAATGPIRIATSAGVATSAASFTVVPAPVIAGVSPTSGAAATTVTLTGSGFTGATSVTFGGATATFTVGSDTSITATVPIAATTGTIRVTTPGGTATSTVQFGILSAAAPTVTAFTPTSGGPGTTVTVTGTDFGGTSAVMLSGVLGGFTLQSATQLTFTVPGGAGSGVIRVVNAAGTGQSTASFTVVPAPFLSSFSPVAGSQGTTITLNGGNFTGTSQVLFGTVPATFTVVSGTQITAAVPAGAVTSSLRVVTPGGTAFGSGTFTVLGVSPPAVTGFTPTMGGVSTVVTVTGARFTGATAVRFNGIASIFTVASDTSLIATVPAGATTGPISVTNSTGTGASSAPFMVGPVPQISGFTPASGTAGTMVTIVGNLFTGATAVQFNGKDAVFTVTGATLITATVPVGATSGRVTVVTPSGSGTSPSNFTVLSSAPPTVASFTPAMGQAGTDVTVVGTNFTGVLGVTFNGASAAFTVAADTGLVATVPAGATTGPIAVRNSLGTATSATNFTVAIPPAVTSFTPTMGNPGDTVMVTGLGFTGATGVKFNGVTATFTVQSNTALTATVPAGTTTGPLSVTGPTGTGTSAMDFTILNPVAPTVTAVNPAVGSTAGGTTVTITGLAFATGATVKFGATAATTVTFTDATTLVAMTPAGAPGAVTVEVTNPDAQKGSLANGFTYVTPGADGGIGGGAGGGGGSGGAGGGMGKGGCGCSTGGPGLILLGLLAFARRRRARPL